LSTSNVIIVMLFFKSFFFVVGKAANPLLS
jgi:hypothetical protein